MRKLWNWLADVFETEVVWIEKDHGQWVKRRRYHPIVKAGAFACVLLLCAAAVRFFIMPAADVESETPGETVTTITIVQSPDIEVPELETAGFPEPEPGPGPAPDGLLVANDEYWVRIDKGGYKLYLYRGTDVEKIYDVAVGKNPGDKERVGDNRTPNGIFTVQSIEDSTAWSHDFQDGKGNIRGAYGPWFIRLRTGWSGIGIHGTHDPASLGSMVSEGCVRMNNFELEELKRFARVKMKVVIEE